MKIYVQIQDDKGEILAEHEADACQPSVWNAPSGKSLVGKMPQNSDNKNTGTYELFRMTFQPVVRVSRPNGYEEPPRPLTGQSLPDNFPKIKSWSKSAPTAPNNFLGFSPTPQRG